MTLGLGKGDRDRHKPETLRDSVSRDHNILAYDYVGYDESSCISFRMYMNELEMRIACTAATWILLGNFTQFETFLSEKAHSSTTLVFSDLRDQRVEPRCFFNSKVNDSFGPE